MPTGEAYAPRLERISKEFPDIRVFGINSNRQDSEVDWRAYGERHSLTFPLLKDHRNEIADTFQAERTPEVFVLDGDFQIAYRGRIDDQYEPGITRQAPTRNDLQEALRELLAGRPVSLAAHNRCWLLHRAGTAPGSRRATSRTAIKSPGCCRGTAWNAIVRVRLDRFD